MVWCWIVFWLRGAFFARVFQNSRLVSMSLASSWARFKMSDILGKMFWLRIWLFTWQRIDNLMLGIFHGIFRIYCCTGCVPPLGAVRAANWRNTYNILLTRVQDCVFLDFELKLSSERPVCNFSILSSSFLFLLILFPLCFDFIRCIQGWKLDPVFDQVFIDDKMVLPQLYVPVYLWG